MLIDTHSHIYSEEFSGEFDEVISRSLESGVDKIMLPNIDSSSIKMMLDLSGKYPDICFPMLGLHPTSVKEDFEEELEVIEFWLNKHKFYGIGEIGIDLYWDDTWREEQEYVFKRQLKYAKLHNLPVSIHTRDSFDFVMKILKVEYESGMKGVFHCFTGTIEQANQVLDLGFKIGVGGVVTFKNAGIGEVIAQLSPEAIVLETDAPYLSPIPKRGKRNESAYLVFIQNKVAELFNLPGNEIAKITSQTARELFEI